MVVRCAVKGCKKNARTHRDHTFFESPRNSEIRAKWLAFAGLTKAGIHFKICIDHFDPKCIWKLHPRRLLMKNSIPTIGAAKNTGEAKRAAPAEAQSVIQDSTVQPYNEIVDNFEVTTPSETDKLPSKSMNACGTIVKQSIHEESERHKEPSPPRIALSTSPNSPPCRQPSRLIHNLSPKSLRMRKMRKTILALRSKINRMHDRERQKPKGDMRLSKAKVAKLLSVSAPYLSKEAQILFETQLHLAGLKKCRRRYAEQIKDIALSIFYHSPKAYRYLKKFLNLPSERTLRTYQARFPIYPGLNLSVLTALKEKFNEASPSDKVVSLLFDEINLTAEVHFDPHSGKFFGYADTGTIRQPRVAKSALVVMISWIGTTLKQVLGYFFLSASGNSKLTHELILESVDQVLEHGLIVKVIIFDQGPKNVGFLKSNGVAKEKPYFYRISNKIFVMYDPPHLEKSVRNNVMDHPLQYKGGIVYWSDIKQVFQLSTESPLNLIPKISERHFALDKYSKMRVALAAQVFSESMYTAHLVYKTMFPHKFDCDNMTSQFLIDMDKSFDSLNSSLLRNTIPQKLNYAMSKDSPHAEFLKSMAINFEQARFVYSKPQPQPPCIKGFVLTINSTLQLFNAPNYNFKHLKTRRLNQDPLENLFSTIRQQHGCSMYPSPMQFECGMRHILITQLTKISEFSNCQSDKDNIFAKLSAIKNVEPNHEPTFPITETEIPSTEIDTCGLDIITETQEFTETNAVYYICGYLCKKFCVSHKCTICKQILILENDNEYADHKLFLIMKTYNETHGLMHASENFFTAILSWERQFKLIIGRIIHANNIVQVLEEALTQTCPPVHLCSDASSRAFLQLFIRIRCHWEARFIRRRLNNKNKADSSANQNRPKKSRKFTGAK